MVSSPLKGTWSLLEVRSLWLHERNLQSQFLERLQRKRFPVQHKSAVLHVKHLKLCLQCLLSQGHCREHAEEAGFTQ